MRPWTNASERLRRTSTGRRVTSPWWWRSWRRLWAASQLWTLWCHCWTEWWRNSAHSRGRWGMHPQKRSAEAFQSWHHHLTGFPELFFFFKCVHVVHNKLNSRFPFFLCLCGCQFCFPTQPLAQRRLCEDHNLAFQPFEAHFGLKWITNKAKQAVNIPVKRVWASYSCGRQELVFFLSCFQSRF